MTQCSTPLSFAFFKKSRLVANFDGGQITSDAGLLLVREFDEKIGLTQALSDLIYDPRHPLLVLHPQVELIRQRLYQIIAGYEDANDATLLRHDPIFKILSGRKPEEDPLASQPTLTRLENRIGSDVCWELMELFVRLFIRTRAKPPKQITLEIDPSCTPTYGNLQQLTFFNGHYDTYMYFPNFICDADTGFILAPLLRAGNTGGLTGTMPLLVRVIQMIRQAWPDTRIDFRADSDFAVPELLDWLEENGIPYAIGLATNKALKPLSADFAKSVQEKFDRTGKPQRCFTSFDYKTSETWPHKRRVIAKCEVTDLGTNIRYVVVSRGGRSADLYDWYVQRGGTIENTIGQLKNGFSGGRLSCVRFEANWFRLILHTAAYNLMLLFRESVPVPEIRSADINTIRLKLIKVGGRVRQTVRRVWVELSSSWPFQSVFREAHARLMASAIG